MLENKRQARELLYEVAAETPLHPSLLVALSRIRWGMLFDDSMTRVMGDSRPVKEGYYKCIPSNSLSFAEIVIAMRRAYGNKDPKFLDVGGGIGEKVFMASIAGWSASMVEIVEKYCDVARKYLHGYASSSVYHQDALDFDYRGYDLIYMYQPMRTDDLMQQLTRRIFETADEGTVIMNYGHPLLQYLDALDRNGYAKRCYAKRVYTYDIRTRIVNKQRPCIKIDGQPHEFLLLDK